MWTSLRVTVTKMTGLSMTCVLVLSLQLTGALAQFRGQWGYPGYGGGGYFQRPRAQRFAAYGGYPGIRGRVSKVMRHDTEHLLPQTLLGS